MGIRKILIDENLSKKLVGQLLASVIGENLIRSAHVSEKGLNNDSDRNIWQYAKENNYAILTKDNDFTDLSILLGCPPKVIRLNCGNQTTANIVKIIVAQLPILINFLDKDDLCYLEIE